MPAKPDDRDALLEEFARRCSAEASKHRKKELPWKVDDFARFHCPLNREHHKWNGAPQCRAWVAAGRVVAECPKCCPTEAAREEYTEAVKAAIGWEDAEPVELKWLEVRRHGFLDKDQRNVVHHVKKHPRDGRVNNGEPKWFWEAAPIDEDGHALDRARGITAEKFLAANYPEAGETGRMYHYLCWYDQHRFYGDDGRLKDLYTVVITEGEKDADTLNRLAEVAGAGLIGTCLSHNQPSSLASHHLPVIEGRDVVVIGDCDAPGRRKSAHWSGLLWGRARSVKLVDLDLPGTADCKDLTDWVARRCDVAAPTCKAADELLALLTGTPELTEPAARPSEWRDGDQVVRTAKGSWRADSLHNAERVWTMHPELEGRVHLNVFTGEVEVDEPPWGGDRVVGARDAATAMIMWLERAHGLSLAQKAAMDVLSTQRVAPPRNPLAGLLATEWDGSPRLDATFTRYLPLDVDQATALAYARLTWGDLARKMRGDLASQRVLIGIGTDRALDVAGAILGEHGALHVGQLTQREAERFSRQASLLVQMSMITLVHTRTAHAAAATATSAGVWQPRLGRRVPSPLVIALGKMPDPRTMADLEDYVRVHALAEAPDLAALHVDASQVIAEAVARLPELLAEELPDVGEHLTLDEVVKRERLHGMFAALLHYVEHDVAEHMSAASPLSVMAAAKRPAPLRHLLRDRFLRAMRPVLLENYRFKSDMEAGFRAAAKALGSTGRISLGAAKARELGVPNKAAGAVITPPGILIKDDIISTLHTLVWGNYANLGVRHGSDKPGTPREAAPYDVMQQAKSLSEGNVSQTADTMQPHARTSRVYIEEGLSLSDAGGPAVEKEKGEPENKIEWLQGAEAVAAVRGLLATPGRLALDFETWPTDPRWHGAEASNGAPRGAKGDARKAAELAAERDGRAHVRRPALLALAHEDGRRLLVRVARWRDGEGPAAGEERLTDLAEAFDGPVAADLVAHNAQFDVECLLKLGVDPPDVDCTLVAAKCLHLVAVPEDSPQPQGFGLAALAERHLGRARSKAARDRDWLCDDALDQEGLTYALDDARDCLELWRALRAELDADAGDGLTLLDGYRLVARSILPTAELNHEGLAFDRDAHAELCRRLERDLAERGRELDRLCGGLVANHGSTAQVSNWIKGEVLGCPVEPPKRPNVETLCQFVRHACAGVVRKSVGSTELLEAWPPDAPKLRTSPKGGLTVEDLAQRASDAGFDLGAVLGVRDDLLTAADADRPTTWALVDAVEREACGEPVLRANEQTMLDDWRQAAEVHADLVEQLGGATFADHLHAHLQARGISRGWRTTETGHLKITKGWCRRGAELLAPGWPHVADYLVARLRWNGARKLRDAFGPRLEAWADEDGRVRGQYRTFAAVTGRQSAARPNLQQIPREPAFRALFKAPPGRKLVICDYEQIEMRLAALLAPDEALLDVYRHGRDVHREVAAACLGKAPEDVTKAERQQHKGVGFAMIYGSGVAGLAESGGFSVDEAAEIMGRFLGVYSGIASYRERAPSDAAKRGHVLILPARRVLYNEAAPASVYVNYPIQGTAASVQLRAISRVRDRLRAEAMLGLDAKLVAAVHDEILVECAEVDAAEAAELLQHEMRGALLDIVPAAVEMGIDRLAASGIVDNWAEKP